MPSRPREGERALPHPNLHVPTPDVGRVHPYGDTVAAIGREEADGDAPVYLCTSCGYNWARRLAPTLCPNCVAQDSFVRSG